MNFTLKIWVTFSVSYRNLIKNLTGTHKHSLWLTLCNLTLSLVHFLVIHILQSFVSLHKRIFVLCTNLIWNPFDSKFELSCVKLCQTKLYIIQLLLATTILYHCRYIRNLWIKITFQNKLKIIELLRKNEQLSKTLFKVSLYQVAILFINIS